MIILLGVIVFIYLFVAVILVKNSDSDWYGFAFFVWAIFYPCFVSQFYVWWK